MTARTLSLGGLHVLADPPAPPAPPKKYGLLTIDRHHAHKRDTGEFLRVHLDGEDVTDHCQEAHDGEGWVVMHPMQKGVSQVVAAAVARGRTVATLGDLATEFPWRDAGQGGKVRVSGDVLIKPGPEKV